MKSELDLLVEKVTNEYIDTHESSYFFHKHINVCLFTWNVASSFSPDELSLALLKCVSNQPEIIVIGFQEIDMKLSAIWAGENVDRSEIEYEIYLALPQNNNYVFLHSQHFGGMSISVCVKNCFKQQILSVSSESFPLGPMNLANKGAVCVSIITRKESFCFICSHFPAHQKNIAARNESYQMIVQKMIIHHQEGNKNLTIMDHEYVYWMGDLNYRIEFNEPPTSIHKIDLKEIEKLRDSDQLLMSIKNNHAFTDFNEATIKFKPTYKLKSSNGIILYNEARTPAWCDRILYRSKNPNEITSLIYNSVEIPTKSDHFPVFGKFQNPIQYFDKDCYNNVQNDAYNHATKVLKINQSKILLSSQDFNFGVVEIFQRKKKILVIKNVSFTEVEFSLNYLKSHPPEQKWIEFAKSDYKLPVGYKEEIELAVNIDEKISSRMSFLESSLETSLVLSVKDGRIYFIEIAAVYLRGILGFPLEMLIKTDSPLKLDIIVLKDVNNCVPIQVLAMTNYILMNYFAAKKRLFDGANMKWETLHVIDILDRKNGFYLHGMAVEDVANALLLFLKCMPKKIFCLETLIEPDKFYDNPIDSVNLQYQYLLTHLMQFFNHLLSLKNRFIPKLFEMVKILEPLFFSEEALEKLSKSKKSKVGETMKFLLSKI